MSFLPCFGSASRFVQCLCRIVRHFSSESPRHTSVHRQYTRWPCPFYLMNHYMDHLTIVDAESYLAVDCEASKPPPFQCKHHQFWYFFLCSLSSPTIESTSLTPGLLCYTLYWIIQFPFMLLSPHKIRWLFLVKGIVVPICWLAMVIWAFVRVPPSAGLFAQHATISGSQLTWSWLSALNSALGVYATLSVNIPDFTVRVLETCRTLVT